jgi:menaquinone-dependent protoporphyrinogen IX oxidase
MDYILVAHATHEDQTRKNSQLIAERIRAAGHEVDLNDTTSLETALLSQIYAGAVLDASPAPSIQLHPFG